MENYEKTYDDFWKEIIEKDGSPSMDQIKRELHDYSFLLDSVPSVYCEVTGNKISKPNTLPSEVIGEFENYLNDRINEAVKEAVEEKDQRITELESAMQEFVDDYDNPETSYWKQIFRELLTKKQEG